MASSQSCHSPTAISTSAPYMPSSVSGLAGGMCNPVTARAESFPGNPSYTPPRPPDAFPIIPRPPRMLPGPPGALGLPHKPLIASPGFPKPHLIPCPLPEVPRPTSTSPGLFLAPRTFPRPPRPFRAFPHSHWSLMPCYNLAGLALGS